MGKYFCPDCNQSIDDVVCPICGTLAEDLRFDEGSPDGRSDRYDESLVTKAIEPDSQLDDDTLPLPTEDEPDDE
jgi:hypothetical protein